MIALAGTGLDTLSTTFSDREGGRRRSAFGVLQEYLNAQDGALWGLVCDGFVLRLVRKNTSLSRSAWVEADLHRMFEEGRLSDFTALWLLCHASRFGRTGQPVTECPLETWRNAGYQEGTRAREHLRRGVEDALVALGEGFLRHPLNAELRIAIGAGRLSGKDYYGELLRLVYRLIFLITAEERALLHPVGTSERAKTTYARGYSLGRLRERSVKRGARDRFSDVWETTKVVFRCLAKGEPRLGVPSLSGIFASGQCLWLDRCRLTNDSYLAAIYKLTWLRETSRESAGLTRVNW